MLVNGETDYSLHATQGDVIRFYITNAAHARPFNFAIAGAQMKLVGADAGAYKKDTRRDSVILGPSERAVVEVLFNASGTFTIQNKTPDKTDTLGNVVVTNTPAAVSYKEQFSQLKTHQETVRSIDSFRQYVDRTPDTYIKLSVDTGGNMMSAMGGHMMPGGTMMGGMMQASPGGIEWEDENQAMNEVSGAESIKWNVVDQATGKENRDIDWSCKRGDPVTIRIFNDPNTMHPMQHPIHFHGQRFLVLSRDGVKETNVVWKDTVLIPSGETVDMLLDTSNPGTWMAHCHIAEHLEAGMMFTFEIT